MSIIPPCVAHSYPPVCTPSYLFLSDTHILPAQLLRVFPLFLYSLLWQRMHVPDKLSLLCIRLCVISFYTVAPCIKACLKAFHTGCHVAQSDSLARIKPEKEREGGRKRQRGGEGEPDSEATSASSGADQM